MNEENEENEENEKLQKKINKIRRYSLVEYYRHRELYYLLESYDNGEELKWIHSMACFYAVEISFENEEKNEEENKEENEEKICELIKGIQNFEMEVRWYYQKGIEDATLKIRDILQDRFISYDQVKTIDNSDKESKEEYKDEYNKEYNRMNHIIYALLCDPKSKL